MKKRRLLWLACLVVLVLTLPGLPFGIYAVIGKLRKDPFYRGLPASYWSRSVRTWSRSDKGAEPVPYVADLLAYFGVGTKPAVLSTDPEAVPVLLALLRTPDKEVSHQAADVLASMWPDVPFVRALLAALDDPSPGVSDAALRVFSNFPPWRGHGAISSRDDVAPDDPSGIGTKEGWSRRLAERGFALKGHRLGRNNGPLHDPGQQQE
jgi:hypothetical protein